MAGEDEVYEEEWLIFSHQVTKDGCHAGNVEIAFSELENQRIQRVDTAPLVAFFPTERETHLGFLMQGPYRTTPNRENIPHFDDWNKHLVRETASLLVTSLRWLRDNKLLDVAVLGCLPLKSTQFGKERLFAPLFEATKAALRSESLLPRDDKGYAPASNSLLGRTRELRELFSPDQLLALYGKEAWLSGEITSDREPVLREYLMQELDVAEVTPESLISKLDKTFLETQPDDWILRFYEFLSGQSALGPMLRSVPLIRMKDGCHVTPDADKVFLPGDKPTRFFTVHTSVCESETARKFLESLGLREVDPVDEVIENVIPKYQDSPVNVGDDEYDADIQFILKAYDTDLMSRRDKLIAALCIVDFVKTVDAGDGSERLSRPSEVYLATEAYRKLFTGVQGILFVDNTYECMRGEKVCDLLKDCWATPPDSLADVVIKHILPKYQGSAIQISEAEYASDIERILAAYSKTDRYWQRQRLMDELKRTEFVMAIDKGDGSPRLSVPDELYLSTERLKELFSGITGVLIVDDTYECLRGENVRKLLVECGAMGSLKPVAVDRSSPDSLSSKEMQELREKSGQPWTSERRKDMVTDWTLHGLKNLLEGLPYLDADQRRIAAKSLWEELVSLKQGGSRDIFTGRYTFTHYGDHTAPPFPAAFVRLLNIRAWVPDIDGTLKHADAVPFGDLGWEENSFLQKKILFKPRISESIAREAGIEPEMLDELKKRGISTKSDLLEAIGDIPDGGQQVAEDPVGDDEEPNGQRGEIPNGFDEALLETMTPNPPKGPSNPVVLPPGGPHTPESAVRDTDRSSREGRSGRLVSRTSTRFELTDDAKDLAERVKSMSLSDYGNRCQICGSTFLTRNGEFQGFADHIVDPSKHSLTNHFGNLLSLCGWHYALISYGQWVPLDPRTRHQSQLCDGGLNTKQLRDWLVAASEEIDNDGNPYVAIPVRFWNVYLEWSPGPETIDQEIRFSKPHWTYLCELLKT